MSPETKHEMKRKNYQYPILSFELRARKRMRQRSRRFNLERFVFFNSSIDDIDFVLTAMFGSDDYLKCLLSSKADSTSADERDGSESCQDAQHDDIITCNEKRKH